MSHAVFINVRFGASCCCAVCARARLIHDRKKSCLTEIANKAARTETARRAPTTDITLACAFVSLKAISQRIHQQRIMSLAAKTDLCFSSP